MGSSCVGHAFWFVPVPTPNECLLDAPKRRRRPGRTKAELEEIRVCTNRTCRKQGSLQTLEILTGLAPPNVAVKSCGCLGRCGSGPNAVLLPDGVLVSHCGTAARAAQVMSAAAANYTGDDGDAIRRTLDALAIRKNAQAEIDQAKFSEAELLLSQAIDLKPFGGLHVIYRYRSLARLGAGKYVGAVEDAREALKLAPKYPEAYICEGDAFVAMKEYDAAEKSYTMCLEIDPSIRHSRSFKTRVAKLQEKLSTDVPCNQQ